MLRYGKTKVAKEEFYGANLTIKILYVDNVVNSKLIETKFNSKHLIRYLDGCMRPLVLILPRMSRYVKTYK